MSAKKQTITKSELLTFNEYWKDAKVKGLSQESTKNYLYLKIKVSEHVKSTQEQVAAAQKTLMSELGYKDGDSIQKEHIGEVNRKVNEVIRKVLDETVELDTHILTSDDLFNCLLGIDENNSISTEGKAILMKHLIKE